MPLNSPSHKHNLKSFFLRNLSLTHSLVRHTRPSLLSSFHFSIFSSFLLILITTTSLASSSSSLSLKLLDFVFLQSGNQSTMVLFNVSRIETTPFDGQKPGTSGLRKKVFFFFFTLLSPFHSFFNSFSLSLLSFDLFFFFFL